MRGAELLAGATGLARAVTSVNIVEVPDVHRWLNGGEFLFSSGFPWRRDEHAFADALRRLDEVGVAGLGIKLGTYLDAVPATVAQLADDLGLPLVRVPADVAYMDVIEPLYQRVTARRQWALERSAEVTRTFVPLGLDHQSADRILAALATAVGNTVYLIDRDADAVTVAAPGRTTRCTPVDALEEPAAALVHGIAATDLGRSPMPAQIGCTPVIGAALTVRYETHGHVFVTEDRSRFSELVPLALAHAADMISFIFLSRQSRVAGRRESGSMFLHSLLGDELGEEESVERALALGIRLARPCAIFVLEPGRTNAGRRGDASVAIARAFEGTPHLAGELGTGERVVLLQLDADGADAGTRTAAARMREQLARHAFDRAVVAAGTAHSGLDGVRRSRREALTALRAARQRRLVGAVHFDDLGLERVLSQVPVDDVTAHYVATVVGPLLDDDDLLITLQTYLECGGSKAATSAALCLHRSSLIYRLKKIAATLDVDLDDPTRRLELWVALRLHRMDGRARATGDHAVALTT